jgi:hypothetical protein
MSYSSFQIQVVRVEAATVYSWTRTSVSSFDAQEPHVVD